MRCFPETDIDPTLLGCTCSLNMLWYKTRKAFFKNPDHLPTFISLKNVAVVCKVFPKLIDTDLDMH